MIISRLSTIVSENRDKNPLLCFDLPRLSEDLDFDIEDFVNFSLKEFAGQLEDYFKKDLQIKNFYLKVAGNRKQIYLRKVIFCS